MSRPEEERAPSILSQTRGFARVTPGLGAGVGSCSKWASAVGGLNSPPNASILQKQNTPGRSSVGRALHGMQEVEVRSLRLHKHLRKKQK